MQITITIDFPASDKEIINYLAKRFKDIIEILLAEKIIQKSELTEEKAKEIWEDINMTLVEKYVHS